MSGTDPVGIEVGPGSYAPEDVTFLLQRVEAPFVTIEEKERLIQSGAAHYGQLLSPELAPGEAYLELYRAALERNGDRMAAGVLRLADHLHGRHGERLVIASLARAGTPVGVLLRRALAAWGMQVAHYSLSIIRDHGLDAAALGTILERHPGWPIAFVDGWTGKGVIGRELRSSVERFNTTRGADVHPDLHVLSDPGGYADVAASDLDYLLPNAMLNATVSGLVSRTLLTDAGWHGAAPLDHLRPHDLSRAFVDDLSARMERAPPNPDPLSPTSVRRERAQAALNQIQTDFGPRPLNHLKPGVGEATRVLLRRAPERLLLRDPDHPDTRHLVQLASQADVPIDTFPDLPWAAVALIRSLDRDP